jgi:hypothetical protein
LGISELLEYCQFAVGVLSAAQLPVGLGETVMCSLALRVHPGGLQEMVACLVNPAQGHQNLAERDVCIDKVGLKL